jgi:membrane associated rhomboid family serine protease
VIPVGDFVRRSITPYVNWTLLAINLAVFIYTLTLSTRPDAFVGSLETSEADRFLIDWGLIPACLTSDLGIGSDATAQEIGVCPEGGGSILRIFSSMFMHAGWAHFIGNMLFLWIFGDNVEDRLGHVRYLFFYLAAGIAAALAQTFLSSDTAVPAVGASGAIAGIMGGYLLLHPTAMVQVIILPLFFLPFFVPAVLLIGIWFAMQLFSGIAEIGQTTAGSGVAW